MVKYLYGKVESSRYMSKYFDPVILFELFEPGYIIRPVSLWCALALYCCRILV